MAAFEYLALDADGKSKKGVIDGDTSRQIRSQLRNLGLFPVEIHRLQESQGVSQAPRSRARVSASRLALLTRQLATMVRAGIPLEESLRAVGEQIDHARLRSVIAGVRTQITEGSPLNQAMASYPGVFPDIYRVMVEAGESSGRLEEVLDRLADYTEERQALRQSISVAMIYPCIVTCVAVLVVIALLTYVVPEVIRVFEQTGQALPWLTELLISCSTLLRAYGIHLLLGIFAGVFLWKMLLRNNHVRWRRDWLLLHLPLVGKFNRTLNAARLSRSLAILTDSGVPLLEALEISARMIRNMPLYEIVADAAVHVREGGKLHQALSSEGYFPALMIHMLMAGEESGELESMLDKAATQQERELQAGLAAVTAMLEPMLILLMGGVVLVIVLAILLPIFEMNQLVGS